MNATFCVCVCECAGNGRGGYVRPLRVIYLAACKKTHRHHLHLPPYLPLITPLPCRKTAQSFPRFLWPDSSAQFSMGRFVAPPWHARPQLLLDGIALSIADIQGLWAVLFVYCTVRVPPFHPFSHSFLCLVVPPSKFHISFFTCLSRRRRKRLTWSTVEVVK